MSNNFGFLKPLNTTLYEHCRNMDSSSKTRPNQSINNLRESIEEFMKWFAKLNKINPTKQDGTNKTTFDLINEAYDKRLLLNWQKNDLHDVRRYSNKGIHNEIRTTVTENMRYIQKFHKVVAVYLRYKNLIDKPVFFDENTSLIGNYQPIEEIDILDYEEGCEKKYLCTYVGHGDATQKQYVVRQFRKGSELAPQEEGFWRRDLLTLQRLSDEDLNYIVKSQNIDTEQDNELFFTCYELSKSDVNLTEYTMQKFPVAKRLTLLHQIAKGLLGLHKAYEPVYHRALTPSSIYIKSHRSGRKSILIGNFEYSKLEDVDGVTMVSKVFKRSKDSFRAPELELGEPIEHWDKVDVYSFGMIILFVFNIRGPNAGFRINQLRKYKFSDEFIDLVDRMVNIFIADRPSMTEVESVIRKELSVYEATSV